MARVALGVLACAAAALTVACGVAVAQATLPAGATIAADVEPFRVFKPVGNPGGTSFNAVDRLAIENLIRAYSLAYDNGQADAWLGLFTEDAVFVAGVPGGPPIASSGVSG